MKLAECSGLTTPRRSSSRMESALSWLKQPSLHYISHIELMCLPAVIYNKLRVHKSTKFLDRGTRVWAALLQRKLVTNIPLSLKGLCLPVVLGKENSPFIFNVKRGRHYKRREMRFRCDFFKCFIKSWIWPRLFLPIMKVIIIPWEVENNKAQWETEWYSGSKIKGLKDFFGCVTAQDIYYVCLDVITAMLNVYKQFIAMFCTGSQLKVKTQKAITSSHFELFCGDVFAMCRILASTPSLFSWAAATARVAFLPS